MDIQKAAMPLSKNGFVFTIVQSETYTSYDVQTHYPGLCHAGSLLWIQNDMLFSRERRFILAAF